MPIAWLLLVLAAMQAVCWLLARGLGRRLERHVMALGILLPVLFLSPWLRPSNLLFPGDFLRKVVPDAPLGQSADSHELLNDVIFQLIPWELEVRHALKAGHLPFWSDLLEGGSSPWINPQASVLSPLALVTRPVPIQYWLLAMLALKIQLAFEGTWLLARALAIRRPASLLTAAGFSLAGGVMAWSLFPVTAAVVWVPWLAVGVIGLFRERPEPRRIATVAVLTAALLLSGHPETAAIGGLFAAVCGLGLWARRRSLPVSLGAAALAALLGFGLAAPHLVPFAAYLPHSQRAQETIARQASDFHSTVWDPFTWFLPASRAFLMAPFNPHAFGRPYQDDFTGPFSWPDADSGYAGLVALTGALFAAASLRRRRVWPFLGFALAGFLLAAEFVPFANLIDSIDVLQVVCYRRFLSVSVLALAVAGGMGIDHWLRSRRGWALRLPALLAVAAVGYLCRFELDSHVVTIWLLLGAAVCLAAWRPRWGAAALGVALLLDLVPWAWSHLPTGQTAYFYPHSRLLTQLQVEVSKDGSWRAVGEDYAVYSSLLPVYGIADVRPHNPLAPMAYLEGLDAAFGFNPSTANYFAPLRHVEHPFLDFLNVCCVVWESHNPVPKDFQRIDPGTSSKRLYRNPDALPRWFVPSRIDVIAPSDLTAWIKALDDGRRVAVFQDQRQQVMPQPPPARLQTLLAEPGRIALAVSAPQDTVLATSLQLPQGWSAQSGGQQLPKLVVNGAFLGLRVPRGEHRVELRYIPPGFVAGAALGGLSLLVCGALLVWPIRPFRR